MLNKLRYFRDSDNTLKEEFDRQKWVAKERFIQYFEEKDIDLTDIGGGTLGITFLCNGLIETPVFVKTHLMHINYKIALKKEYQILKSIYDTELFLECIQIPTERNGASLYLLMDYLKQGCDLSKKKILEVIEKYKGIGIVGFDGEGMYDISELLIEAQKSLYDLAGKGFYSTDIEKMAATLLNDLAVYLESSTRILCHGDLADKNIMINSYNKNILLDWEDAFWGIEGYDYLYWLTFFNHRKFYNNPEIFELPGLQHEVRAGILTLILLIKNAITYYSGEYMRNKLSMNDRLKEIYTYIGIRI